jgi:predicted lipoprotein with Yx(FWY)xxD motif
VHDGLNSPAPTSVSLGMATNHLTRKAVLSAAPIALLALVAAGCGGSSGGDSTVTPQSSGAATTTASVAVSNGYLVDGSGRTLYLFEADTSSTSTCSGACAAAWPPATTQGAPKATGEAKASLLGTTKRSDGSTQVTYAGHPLYQYAGDTAPGDTNGAGSEEYGAEWYPVTPTGKALEDEGDDDESTPSSDDSGYSY